MSTTPTPTASRARPRLSGIDLARALALIGMVATHTMELATVDGDPLLPALLSGKASALFAVLAGFSITLSTRSYNTTRNAALSLVARGLIIAAIGIILGSFTTNIAVILVNYGIMFMVAAAVFRARTMVLAVLAPAWLVIAPIIGFAIRSAADLPKAWDMPHLGNITDVPYMLMALFSTGYFPILEWFGYILVGLLLSRLNWKSTATSVRVLIAGSAAALVSVITSSALLRGFGGMEALEASTNGVHPKEWGGLLNALYVANAGSTPTDTWWWMAMAGPHSSTPFDMVHTAGIAAMVIALSTLACNALGRNMHWIQPLLTLGTMSLTTYSFHVIFREFSSSFLLHVALMVAIAAAYRAYVSHTGPLERLVSRAVQSVAPKKAVRKSGTVSTVSEEAHRQEV